MGAKFPKPPDLGTIHAVPSAWIVLPAGHELWRIYLRGGRHPALPARPFFHRALADPLLLPALAGAADDLGYTLGARAPT